MQYLHGKSDSNYYAMNNLNLKVKKYFFIILQVGDTSFDMPEANVLIQVKFLLGFEGDLALK